MKIILALSEQNSQMAWQQNSQSKFI